MTLSLDHEPNRAPLVVLQSWSFLFCFVFLSVANSGKTIVLSRTNFLNKDELDWHKAKTQFPQL